MAERRQILVIKHSALGDIVLSTGMFKTLRERHPEAHLALMTKGCFAEFCKSMGIFDEVIVDNRAKFDFGEWRRICKTVLADREWERIYDMQANNRTLKRYYPIVRALTRHALAWGRITDYGFEFRRTPKKRAFSWSRAVLEREEIAAREPDLSFCHGSHEHFGMLPERYVLLIPGCSAGHPYKKWPAGSYRELSRRYGERGVKSVVMGTRAEAEEIRAVVEGNADAIDFMGRSSLADIPDLARGAELVVGNDTGPSHMARIAGAKTITLFSSVTRNSAREAANAVNIIKDSIADISVDEVLKAAEDLV